MAAVALVIAVRTGRVRARSRVEIRVTVWCPVFLRDAGWLIGIAKV
jgi:hypothetical protein